ncbi:MAG: hypothetical protein IPG06_02510 [Haliea sp.]|jgi:hypothetical protein|nr:hypothetical protein [Haliea sp.]
MTTHYPFDVRTRRLILVLPIFFIILFFLLYANFPRLYLRVVKEDGLIEYLQALCFLSAAVIGFLTAYRLSKTPHKFKFIVISLFSIGSLLIFGEEISWGQRIIGFSTPETISQINTQNEFTAHNLFFLQRHTRRAYYVISGYACLAWLVFLLYRPHQNHIVRYVVPGWETITLFAPIAVFYYLHYLYFNLGKIPISEQYVIWPEVRSSRHQETFESFFAAGFIVVALRNLRLARSESSV